MILRATHTHFYPGHRGTVSGPTRLADLPAGGACVVEFSDGSATLARLKQSGAGWQLRTDAYRTAAGTGIAAKRWRIDLRQSSGRVDFRILKNSPQQPSA